MKRYTLILLLFIAGCSHQRQLISSEVQQAVPVKKIKLNIPTEIFHSDVKGAVSKREADAAVKLYLNSNIKLTKQHDFIAAVSMPCSELSRTNKKKVRKIILMTQQNDNNFKEYINNNQFPGKYKQEFKRINHYVSARNEYLNVLKKRLENKNASIEIIQSLGYRTYNANLKEQQSIENFLKKIDTTTEQLFRQTTASM